MSIHLVWATYDRLPKASAEVMPTIRSCVNEVADEAGCPLIAFGGMPDHVHVLVHFATNVTVADLVKSMKGRSARVVNVCYPDLLFKWQGGYGVFPVTPQLRKTVIQYIANQEQHHANNQLKPLLEDSGYFPQDEA